MARDIYPSGKAPLEAAILRALDVDPEGRTAVELADATRTEYRAVVLWAAASGFGTSWPHWAGCTKRAQCSVVEFASEPDCPVG